MEVAHSFDEHMRLLDASLANDEGRGRTRFIREFVRPYGWNEPATPRFVEFVESMGALKPTAPRRPLLAALWRSLAKRAARTRDDDRYERWTLSERELASLQRLRDNRQTKAQERRDTREAEKARKVAKQAARARALAEKRARADAERVSRERAG